MNDRPDNDADRDDDTDPDPADADRRARRRRRLAKAGDSSVERSADDSDIGWSEPGHSGGGDDASLRDDELRREVPPHHG